MKSSIGMMGSQKPRIVGRNLSKGHQNPMLKELSGHMFNDVAVYETSQLQILPQETDICHLAIQKQDLFHQSSRSRISATSTYIATCHEHITLWIAANHVTSSKD